jgi:hypothetical protein
MVVKSAASPAAVFGGKNSKENTGRRPFNKSRILMETGSN